MAGVDDRPAPLAPATEAPRDERRDGIVCFATQGLDHGDGRRIRELLAPLQPQTYGFDRSHRVRSALGLLRLARRERPALLVMEGTGMAGGVLLLLINLVHGIPYVVSSGDAVGPYLGLRSPVAGALGGLYERLLCRRCAGFIGWTPYLAGRALTFGAPRAMTAAGWTDRRPAPGARERVRAQRGIPQDAIVIGFTGSLNRSRRRRYTYGAELVQAVTALARTDVVVCIVGDGPGLDDLRELAGDALGTRVLLPGSVAPEAVPDHLASFDLASLSQSVDRVGAFRYTIKLSEYLAAGLPVVTGQTPLAYDLDEGDMWRLPGSAPWDPRYVAALGELLETLDPADVARRREAVARRAAEPFDRDAQQRRARAFIEDLLADAGAR